MVSRVLETKYIKGLSKLWIIPWEDNWLYGLRSFFKKFNWVCYLDFFQCVLTNHNKGQKHGLTAEGFCELYEQILFQSSVSG